MSRQALDQAKSLGSVPDRVGVHLFGIGGSVDVDEVVVALRLVDRLELDPQLLKLGFGLADPLRLFARPDRAERAEENVFHGNLHIVLIAPAKVRDYTPFGEAQIPADRKSTRLNSSH